MFLECILTTWGLVITLTIRANQDQAMGFMRVGGIVYYWCRAAGRYIKGGCVDVKDAR